MKKIYVIIILCIFTLQTFAQNYSQMPQWILEEKLAQSVFRGDEQKVKDLLSFGVSAKIRDKFNQPLLLLNDYSYSSKESSVQERVRGLLISKGADINAQNDFGTTWFMNRFRRDCTMTKEDEAKYQKLGVNGHIRDKFGGSFCDTISFKAGDKYPASIPEDNQTLIDYNAFVWRAILEDRSNRYFDFGNFEKYKIKRYKNSASVGMALAYYSKHSLLSEVPYRFTSTEKDKNYENVLFYAAQVGSADSLTFIDNKNHLFDEQNNNGETPMIRAAKFGQDYFVFSLLRRGANPNIIDKDGNNALYYAAKYDYPKVVFNLLIGRIDSNRATEDGTNPLILAVKLGHTEVVKSYTTFKILAQEAKKNKLESKEDLIMIETAEKINLNAKDKLGKTALIYAAENGFEEMLKTLLDAGIDKSIKDSSGKTAKQYAEENKHQEIVKMLE